MKHRHLNHESLSLAAIDDIIARGKLADWVELRNALRSDRSIWAKVVRGCEANISDPYAQRYHLCNHYARKHAPS